LDFVLGITFAQNIIGKDSEESSKNKATVTRTMFSTEKKEEEQKICLLTYEVVFKCRA